MKTQTAATILKDAETVSASEFWFGGGLAGIVAGTVMALASMLRSMLYGVGFWLPLKDVAGCWYGVDALLGGPAVILVGGITHLGVAAAFGILFGMAVHRETPAGLAALKGLFYGAGVWFLMTYGVLPQIDPVMQVRVLLSPKWWFLLHMVYGGMLGVTPAFRRRFRGEA